MAIGDIVARRLHVYFRATSLPLCKTDSYLASIASNVAL